MDFKDLPQTRKGTLGELELDKFLISRNIIPYQPIADKAHPFDRLCASSDKKKLYIVECKTKASRSTYPDTGINKRNYKDYVYIRDKYGIDVWLFFVDEFRSEIYGNLLTELEKPYTVIHNNMVIHYPWIQATQYDTAIIYFPLERMLKISDISADVTEQMKGLSRRRYGYPTYNIEIKQGEF